MKSEYLGILGLGVFGLGVLALGAFQIPSNFAGANIRFQKKQESFKAVTCSEHPNILKK